MVSRIEVRQEAGETRSALSASRVKTMVLSVNDRKDIISKFQTSENDTGSAGVQVALITERIKYLSDHLKANPKDYAGERGLSKLVGQRKRLLAYLKKSDFAAYGKITKELNLRK